MSRDVSVYCVGLLFALGGDEVVLIKKTHPTWQAGKWNGPGGRVRDDERPHQALEREYEEETGLKVLAVDWAEVAAIKGQGFAVHVYAAESGAAHTVTARTDEVPKLVPVAYALQFMPIIPDLRWVLPLAQQRNGQLTPVVYNRRTWGNGR